MLWNTFIFWLYVIITRSTEETLEKWPTALGLAVIVGMIINVNAFAMFKANRTKLAALRCQLGDGDAEKANRKEAEGLVMLYWKANASSAFRFFFIPFCVSTYTITMKYNSDYFWWIFPSGKDMAIASIILILVGFTVVMSTLRKFVLKLAKQDVNIRGDTIHKESEVSAVEIDVECVGE